LRLGDLDRFLDSLFQVSFPAVDRYGQETILQSLMVTTVNSVYVSARIPYRPYEFSIGDKFKKLCILQDPYMELAETIIDLGTSDVMSGARMGLREQLSLDTPRKYLAQFDMSDPDEVRRCLRRMPDDVQAVILNPMSRQLAARSENETSNTSYVAASIDALSTFDIVGIRERPATALDPLAAVLGISATTLPSMRPASRAAQLLAHALRTLPFVARLLDLDLDVYNQVTAALESSQ
jgi:DNA-binding transcriptional regulator YiaG